MDRSSLTLALALCMAGLACAKPPPPAPAPEPTPVASEPEPEPEPEPTEEEKLAAQQEEQAKAIAGAVERVQKRYDEEAARWQAQGLEPAVAKLAATKFKSTKKAMPKLLASAHREPGNAERDAYRHPTETLVFFGITPKSTVVEVGPGTGWYTELLAPLLAAQGKLVVPMFDAGGPAHDYTTFMGKRLEIMLGKSQALYGKVERVPNPEYEKPTFGPEGSADVVLVTREMHNWWSNKMFDAWLAAAHAVLKPGGTLAVEQHRAAEGADPDQSAQKGYLPQKWLIEQIEARGFALVGNSEINANPNDTKDYEGGVWTLPPVLALGDKDRDKYVAIGESDRMTLKFEKR